VRLRKWLLWGLGGTVLLLLAIQFVPYGRTHENPSVVAEPAWDSPATRDLAVRACYDCHSNETVWPWYSNVAPMAWFIQHDVDEGRARLNFSDWSPRAGEEAAEVVREGEMPPAYYTWMHSSARFSNDEQAELARGLQATVAGS